MDEFYYQNRKWSHFEGIYRLWSYQSHLQLGGNQIHLHFCKNYWFSESEMIQVPIHVIPKLKYDHALLLFETLSTVSKKEILIFFFYVNHFLMAPSSMQDPEPWALPGCGQVWYSSVPGDHHRESFVGLHSMLKVGHSAIRNLEIFWTVENQEGILLYK